MTLIFTIHNKTCSVIGILLLLTLTISIMARTMRYCNRGYCYTKNEPHIPTSTTITAKTISSSSPHRHDHDISSSSSSSFDSTSLEYNPIKRVGFDFCTDREGHLMDCEVLEIMGKEDYMPLEGTNQENGNAKKGKRSSSWEEWSWKTIYDRFNSNFKRETIMKENEVGQNKEEESVSPASSSSSRWEMEPKKGHCFDYDAGYTFDCNLVKNLEEGLLLIEDLRLGGVFTAQPKSGFTTRKNKNKHTNRHPHQEPLHTPDVLSGSEIDPVEDWRTNVELNLEGM